MDLKYTFTIETFIDNKKEIIFVGNTNSERFLFINYTDINNDNLILDDIKQIISFILSYKISYNIKNKINKIKDCILQIYSETKELIKILTI